ncbi:hypothetical protein D9611_008015 [Ephemerocybe angulata]|uniref:Uncharacterized protein n=1 Tax=Ephemerocybe angulata TaxID=980116 RepID=A0A8H5C137_9AGAR|nr:hypothetical protein D9611_008015 [Tulosesus angulatus]
MDDVMLQPARSWSSASFEVERQRSLEDAAFVVRSRKVFGIARNVDKVKLSSSSSCSMGHGSDEAPGRGSEQVRGARSAEAAGYHYRSPTSTTDVELETPPPQANDLLPKRMTRASAPAHEPASPCPAHSPCLPQRDNADDSFKSSSRKIPQGFHIAPSDSPPLASDCKRMSSRTAHSKRRTPLECGNGSATWSRSVLVELTSPHPTAAVTSELKKRKAATTVPDPHQLGPPATRIRRSRLRHREHQHPDDAGCRVVKRDLAIPSTCSALKSGDIRPSAKTTSAFSRVVMLVVESRAQNHRAQNRNSMGQRALQTRRQHREVLSTTIGMMLVVG